MKILCVIDSLGSGGAQRQLVELAKGFKRYGHNVSFLTYHNEGFYLEELYENDIPVECINEKNYLKRLLKMRAFIRRGRYDSVLSFLEAANFISEFAGLPKREWRLLVGERSANPNIYKSYKLKLYRWFHIFADYVVANSYANLKIAMDVSPILSQRKGKVIYNMVDFDRWAQADDYIPLREGVLNLVIAASHQYNKNTKGLIEATYRLSAEEKNKLKVNWYGDIHPNESYNEARKLVTKYRLDHVFTFHKATTKISEKIKYADAIGLFSFHEGLPNVICEGMISGKPIISSSVSDIPLILGSNKKLLFDPLNIDEISSSLSYLLSLSKDQLLFIGEKNKALGYELFNKNKIIDSYLFLLTK